VSHDPEDLQDQERPSVDEWYDGSQDHEDSLEALLEAAADPAPGEP
jgi:hypothetical protein